MPQMFLFSFIFQNLFLVLIYTLIILCFIYYLNNNLEYILNSSTIFLNITKRSQVLNLKEPLNDDILSIIYGSLLGNSSAEKRSDSKNTKITFYQEGSHLESILYLHRIVANLGYCNTNIPKIQTKLSKNGKIKYVIKFSTWSYEQFNKIKSDWYNSEGVKIIPKNIYTYLSPLALAIWIMNNGRKSDSGLILTTNSFKYDDVLLLIDVLYNNYKIQANIQSIGMKDQYFIYITPSSMQKLASIVKPYIIPSMKYKFGKILK